MKEDKIFIIAEAGVNHNGNLAVAKNMVLVAKQAGADAVKFQTFKSEDIVSNIAQKAEYQKKTTGREETQLEMLKKLELSFGEFEELKKYCEEQEIIFLSTPFDLKSMDFLLGLGIPLLKIPSGEITNLPYLLKAAQSNVRLIISTGMCSVEEIEDALRVIKKYNNHDIVLLHCNTEYPTPYADVNLKAMLSIETRFQCQVGYSDHTSGIEVSVAAAALGAEVIEKHFTLDKSMEGPDHSASLNPEELKQMIVAIRNVEQAMGDANKVPSKSENLNKSIVRKSIVAACNIKEGTIYTEKNLAVKRPGTGITPMKWFEVIGKSAPRNFEKDEMVEL